MQWLVTVHRHPDLTPMIANLARVESIKKNLSQFGFSVAALAAQPRRRSAFTISHQSPHALLLYSLKYGELEYCTVEETVVESPKKVNH